jgi:ubiquitin carboxyl-terminal hydrolase 1
MSYAEYPELDAYQQRWNPTESSTITSILLAAGIGAFVLFKTSEVLGYPVWLWLHQFIDMSVSCLRLRAAPGQVSDAQSSDDDTTQPGGMFGNLFGLSPGNLLQKGVRGVANVFSTTPRDVPPGLGNMSNSCYQNSVIQGLASLPSLRHHLSKTISEHLSLTPDTTNGALFDMITKLNNPDNRGQHFWLRGKLKSMSVMEQQDAQEYYSKIVDALEEEVKKTCGAQKEVKDDEPSSNIPNPLQGQLAERLGCTSCGYSSLKHDPFNSITVPLGRNYSYDIRECLDEYCALEYIDGVECPKCTLLKTEKTLAPLAANNPAFQQKLSAVQGALEKEDFEDKTLINTLNIPRKNWIKTTKSKQAAIERAPKSLVLHIQRSSFDEMTGDIAKNRAHVSYPTVLDLGNWCLGSAPSGSQKPDMADDEWSRDPRVSMVPDARSQPKVDSPFQYRLRAAVTHRGRHSYGHYICYRPHPIPQPRETSEDLEDDSTEDSENTENTEFQDSSTEKSIDHTDDAEVLLPAEESIEAVQEPESEQWWRLSDDDVAAIPEAEAHQGDVFMLFYERIDELTPSPSQTDVIVPSSSLVEDAPLPPVTTVSYELMAVDEEAAKIALPFDDDELLDAAPAESSPSMPPTHIEPMQPQYPLQELPASTGQTQLDTEAETSDAESDDAPSTQLTSDYESEADIPTLPKFIPVPQISPHLMRTAGNTSNRGQGSRKSLPLVSAT